MSTRDHRGHFKAICDSFYAILYGRITDKLHENARNTYVDAMGRRFEDYGIEKFYCGDCQKFIFKHTRPFMPNGIHLCPEMNTRLDAEREKSQDERSRCDKSDLCEEAMPAIYR